GAPDPAEGDPAPMSNRRSPGRPRPKGLVLRLEPLEDRILLAASTAPGYSVTSSTSAVVQSRTPTAAPASDEDAARGYAGQRGPQTRPPPPVSTLSAGERDPSPARYPATSPRRTIEANESYHTRPDVTAQVAALVSGIFAPHMAERGEPPRQVRGEGI